jgi:hypothetical protein
MKNLDLKSLLIGFLGAIVMLLFINASSVGKTTEKNIYEFSDKGENEVLRFNKTTGEIEKINVRDKVVTEYYDVTLGFDQWKNEIKLRN